MRVIYKFRVAGWFKFPNDILFDYKRRTYEFLSIDGIVRHISVSVSVSDPQHWPKMTASAQPGIAADFDFKTPELDFIAEELRNLEGFLTFFGVHHVDLENIDVTWEPENAEERENIKITHFQKSLADPDIRSLPNITTDIVARAIVAAYDAFDLQVPLAFYRRGVVDVSDRRYLEACYDFLFMIETIFANGKYRVHQVKESYRSSSELQNAIQNVLNDKDDMAWFARKFPDKFATTLQSRQPYAVSDFIADTRGFIHHHSLARKKIWHPEKQDHFRFEAHLFFEICHRIMMDRAWARMNAIDITTVQGRRRVNRQASGPFSRPAVP